MLCLHISAVVYCFNQYLILKESKPNEGKIEFTTDFQYYIDLYQTWLVLGTCCQTNGLYYNYYSCFFCYFVFLYGQQL